MRILALILTVMAAIVLIAPASPQDGGNLSRKEQIKASAKKVKELQQERIAILRQMVDATTTLFQNGRAEFDAAYEARVLLLQAELDAAEKESDRITLYKNMVDVMKGLESFAKTRVESGRGTQVPVYKARAARLEAEINLERAKAKEAKGAK